MAEIKLGDKVKDRITGLTGIAIGVTTWLYGCRRLVVQPQELKDGKPVEFTSFDEPQLELVEDKSSHPLTPNMPRKTGGPMPTQTRGPDPTRR